jgi:Zn-dependent protease
MAEFNEGQDDGVITLGLRSNSEFVGGVNPESIALLDELKNPPVRTWTTQLGVLAISLVVFVSFGLLQWSVEDLAVLVIVLFVHESGHFLAMRAFGYRDVQMFFVPGFGAAVSGSQSNAPGYQRTLVALAGPVPGILIGVALAFGYLLSGQPHLFRASTMFLLLNAFNLLPLLPLDGGRVLQETLFCRGRWLEAGFQVTAGAGLLLLAISAGDRLLGLLGAATLWSVRSTLKLGGIAMRLRQDEESSGVRSPSEATLEFVTRASDDIESTFGRVLKRATMAGMIRSLIEKLHPQPPGAWATVLLLAMYGGAIVLAFAGAVLVAMRQAQPGTL